MRGLIRAGERAAGLAASDEAARYFGQAADLADGTVQIATLRERAGEAALAAGRFDEATAQFEQAIVLLEEAGETHPAARVSARLGEIDWRGGRLEEGIARMERAYGVLAGDEPDEDFAALAAQLGRIYTFTDDTARASELLEEALTLAEVLALPEILSQVLNSAGVVAALRSRFETSQALFGHSLKVALEHDLPTAALRAYNNVADSLAQRDRYDEALAQHERGIALARRVGNRFWEWTLLSEMATVLRSTGRWAESRVAFTEIPAGAVGDTALDLPLVEIDVQSGNVEAAREHMAPVAWHADDEDVQGRMAYSMNEAILATRRRRRPSRAGSLQEGDRGRPRARAHPHRGEASLHLRRRGGDRARRPRYGFGHAGLGGRFAPRRAGAVRARARCAVPRQAERGPAGGGARIRHAISIFRELGVRFWLAVALLEHAEWLAAAGGPDEAESVLPEAAEIFEQLGAKPWLERLECARLPVAGVSAP